MQTYYEKNKEQIKKRSREYHAAHKEEIAIRNKKYREDNKELLRVKQMTRRIDSPCLVMFNGAKSRAKKKGIEFGITIDDIEMPDVCPLIGIPIKSPIEGRGPKPGSPFLDRIDNSKGYVKGNVWVISFLANRMKNDANSSNCIVT